MTAHDHLVVKVVADAQAIEVFRTDRTVRAIIGSDTRADIRITDDSFIQPLHTVLEIDPPQCRMIVMAGRPLVRVNRRMTTQAELKPGDQFTVGRTVFEISMSQETERPADFDPEQRTIMQTTIGLSDGERSDKELRPPMQPPAAPPGYEIIRPLGHGGMGVVYEVIQKESKTRMAIKFLHPTTTSSSSEQPLRMFLREASVLSRLQHPRIVQFHEMGWSGGRVFLVMEYVQTIDVPKLLASVPLSKRIRIATGLICQVLDALHYAHSNRVVHRDVKPSNILVSRDAKSLNARLSDFGLAKNFENAGLSGMTADGEIRGTLAYMAPEQFLDSLRAKPAADIYSVGVSLFYLLTSELPFKNIDSVVRRMKSLNDQPRSLDSLLPDIPDGLSEVVSKAMQPDPESRQDSAKELRAALLPFTRGSDHSD